MALALSWEWNAFFDWCLSDLPWLNVHFLITVLSIPFKWDSLENSWCSTFTLKKCLNIHLEWKASKWKWSCSSVNGCLCIKRYICVCNVFFIYTRRTVLTGLMYLSIPATPSSGSLGRCVSLPLSEGGLNLGCVESSNPWNVGQRMWNSRKAAFCRFVNPAMEQLFCAVGEIMPLRFSPMGVGSQV